VGQHLEISFRTFTHVDPGIFGSRRSHCAHRHFGCGSIDT